MKMQIEKYRNKIGKIYFNLSSDLLVILDNKGRIVDINKNGCKILGCNKKNIVGKDWFSNFLPEAFRKEVKSVFNKIIKGDLKGVEFYENPIKTKNGNLKLISWHNTYLKDEKGRIILTLSAGVDITEKRKIEAELKSQNYLFKTLFEYAPDAYFILDFKGNILEVNQRVEEIAGYNKKELINKNIFKSNLLPKKYFPVATKSIMLNLAGKQSGPDEYEIIKKNGKNFYVEIVAKPIQLNDKNAILCIARDITERKKIQKQIEMDSFIFNSLNDIVFICDKEGNIIFANNILNEIVENGEKSIKNMVIPKNKIIFKEIFKHIIKNKKFIYEANINKKDGSLMPVEVYSRLIKIDNEKFILNIAHDLTYRIKTDEEIRNTIQELNQILGSTSSAIFITGKDGVILKANKRFFELFELKESEVIGNCCGKIFNFPEHDCFFNKIIQGDIIIDLEREMQLFSGKKMIVLINAQPFRNANGEIIGVIADFKDIGKIKEAERVLQGRYEKLREFDSMKTTFFSMVSHELKNPLTSIKGFTTLLYGGAVGILTEQQKDFIKTISNNTERLLNLINELLDMSRIESATFSIQKKTTNIVNAINNAIKEMKPIAEQKNINLIFANEVNEYFVEIDEYRIVQVIINIINNAIKFMQNGKNIYISVSIKNKKEIKLPEYVDIILENKQYFIISIKDEGPGINKENLVKIFDKFYQIRKTDKSKGLGLGLFIAKAIIDAHKGFIYAESEGESKGATFNILL